MLLYDRYSLCLKSNRLVHAEPEGLWVDIIIIGLFLVLAEDMNMNILLVANVLYLCIVVAGVHRVQGRDDQLVVPG